MTRRNRFRKRKGNIVVLSALIMIGMICMLAFAIDIGYMMVAETELQRCADAAAIAATWDLIDENALSGNADAAATAATARATAQEFAGHNVVLKGDPTLPNNDVLVGYMADPTDPIAQVDYGNTMAPNAVHVTVRRSDQLNGKVPFYFGPIIGKSDVSLQAEATAALVYNIRGFRAPANGENLGILPIALDLDTWNDVVAGIGTDDWSWDKENEEVVAGSDGILEANLYPQGTGSPGNRGTVDIGSSNNSTTVIARQITDGLTPEDLEFHGGSLEFDENGVMYLNADTGISAGVKDELLSIKGKPRVIPVFSSISANGNNANYTIVYFVGIRVMDVKLTGQMSSKRVIIQPANVVAPGGIPSPSTIPQSQFVYSTVWLVR